MARPVLRCQLSHFAPLWTTVWPKAKGPWLEPATETFPSQESKRMKNSPESHTPGVGNSNLSSWPQGLSAFSSPSYNNLGQNLNFRGKEGGRAQVSQVSYMHREAKKYPASMWKSRANSGDLTSESFRATFACAVQMAMHLPEASSLWASFLDCRVIQSLRKALFCIRTIHCSGKTKRILRLKIQLVQKINIFNHCSPSPLILSWQVTFILISFLLNTGKKRRISVRPDYATEQHWYHSAAS